jgi:hypothetical protein
VTPGVYLALSVAVLFGIGTLIFALAGRLFAKDRLTRAGRWNERTGHMGLGLTTRTLGVIGVFVAVVLLLLAMFKAELISLA